VTPPTQDRIVSTRIILALVVLFGGSHLQGAYAQDEGNSGYNPEPFLSAMTTLVTAVSTCDPFVAGKPLAATAEVEDFFKSLGQPLPVLTDSSTQASLNRFVASQAALLCKEKIDAAMSAYGVQSKDYMEKKPESWPPAPAVNLAPLCSTENCLEF